MVTIVVILILRVDLGMMAMARYVSVYWCQYWCWCWWGYGWDHSHRQEKQIYVKDSGYGVNGNPDISEHSVNRLLHWMAKTTLRKMGKLCIKYLHYFQGWEVILWCSCKKQELRNCFTHWFFLDEGLTLFFLIYGFSLHFCSFHQRVTGILVPGNSRENQLNFFPLDLEKSFSISRSRLETQDW